MCGLETQSHLTKAQGPDEVHLGFDVSLQMTVNMCCYCSCLCFRRDLMFYGFMQIEHDCSRTGEAVFFFFFTAHYDSPRKAQCLAVILNE